ncbi:MAG: chloride channel protein [Alphaproteobacteria bacterium]|nr:chloride channel protein [Alphaproteobacteria bacterium]
MAKPNRRKWTVSRFMLRTRRIIKNDQIILAVIALVVGAGVGVLCVGLRLSIQLIQKISYGDGSESFSEHVASLPWWQIVLIPTCGGLLVGLFIYFVMPGRRPQGVADTIEVCEFVGGKISVRAGLGAAFASILSIGTGASVGREGPAVHLGASFGSWLSERFRFTGPLTKAILGCGVAAAVASSFNAPIAGALFAHEVVVGHYALSAFAPVVIASVTSTVVSRYFFGDFPAFQIPSLELVSLWEFPGFVMLGILSGLTAIMFLKGTQFATKTAQAIPGPQWIRPAIAGMILGIVAIKYPQILGSGYEATDEALHASYALGFLLALWVLKLAMTSLCIGFGFAGGVFAPALVIGALLGGSFGILSAEVFPTLVSDSGAYAIVGMGSVAAATLGAPISTIFIIFEMTSNYSLTIAVMTGAVIASVVFRQTGNGSFFSWQLRQRGVDLKTGYRESVLKGIAVREVMSPQGETVPISTPLPSIRRALQRSVTGTLFVVDDDDHYIGSITLADLANVAFDHDMDELILASDVANYLAPTVKSSDNLQSTLNIMQNHQLDDMAVIRSPENKLLLGRVRRNNLMAAFSEALVEAHNEERD